MAGKHTPGPWKISGSFPCNNAIYAPERYRICENVDTEFNARLIAAAPETAAERDRLKKVVLRGMAHAIGIETEWNSLKATNAELLEALKSIKSLFDPTFENQGKTAYYDAWETARNAIAKANQKEIQS